ncbi:MAG: T9SS type A sorting domain-containing protein [Bacteroidota bacterium]
MPTNTPLRKILTLASLLVLSLTLNNLMAQEVTRKVRIKMEKEVDGKKTVIDTVFTVGEGDDWKEADFMKEYESADGKKVRIEKSIRVEMEGEAEEGQEIEVEVSEDAENVFIIKNGKKKVIRLDGEDEDQVMIFKGKGKKGTWTTEEGEVIELDGDGQKVEVIINGEDGKKIERKSQVIIKEIEKDGEARLWKDEDGKVIIMKGNGAGKEINEEVKVILQEIEGKNDVNIWKGEDGKVIIMKGDEKVKNIDDDAKVIIRKMEGAEGEEKRQKAYKEIRIRKDRNDMSEADKARLKELMQDKEVKEFMERMDMKVMELEEEKGKPTGMIRQQKKNVSLSISKLEEADKASLMENGVKEKEIDGGLVVKQMYLFSQEGQFHLKFEAPEKGLLSVSLRDQDGELIWVEKRKDFEGSFKQALELSVEDKGTYFLTITQNKKATTRKVVLK